LRKTGGGAFFWGGALPAGGGGGGGGVGGALKPPGGRFLVFSGGEPKKKTFRADKFSPSFSGHRFAGPKKQFAFYGRCFLGNQGGGAGKTKGGDTNFPRGAGNSSARKPGEQTTPTKHTGRFPKGDGVFPPAYGSRGGHRAKSNPPKNRGVKPLQGRGGHFGCNEPGGQNFFFSPGKAGGRGGRGAVDFFLILKKPGGGGWKKRVFFFCPIFTHGDFPPADAGKKTGAPGRGGGGWGPGLLVARGLCCFPGFCQEKKKKLFQRPARGTNQKKNQRGGGGGGGGGGPGGVPKMKRFPRGGSGRAKGGGRGPPPSVWGRILNTGPWGAIGGGKKQSPTRETIVGKREKLAQFENPPHVASCSTGEKENGPLGPTGVRCF